jgi:hypothetical protein
MSRKEGALERKKRSVPESISRRFKNKAHMKDSLVFQESPTVVIATNTFKDVPVILRYEDTNLIEVVQEYKINFTTQISIYHQDGTYLAKAVGNRLRITREGEKTGLKIEKHPGIWACEMNGETIFEIRHQTGQAFKTTAELYTPDGCFIKCTDDSTQNLIKNREGLKIGGITIRRNTISGCKIGIWYRKDGFCSIGVN